MRDPLKPPIILFGNVRSGTTMLQSLFATHPEVVDWFEPRTVWTLADPRRPHDRFDETDATASVKRSIRKRFLRYQRRHGNRRVMEKTPSNVMRIPYVRAIFPESKFLYVIREPLANLSSAELRWRFALNPRRTWARIVETPKIQLPLYLGRYVSDHVRVKLLRRRPAYYGVRYPGFAEDLARLSRFQLIARQWVAASQQADHDLADLDPELVLRIRYEDFVEDPQPNFERILAHFELDATPEIERKLQEWVDPGRTNKWRRLDRSTLEEVLPILREEIARQGYEMPDLADLEPEAPLDSHSSVPPKDVS